MKQTTVEKTYRLKQRVVVWQWGKLPRSPQLLPVFHTAGWDLAGQAVHQARGWERRDKGRVQLSVLSDYVSPVPGSDGPNPELETMWVTVTLPGTKGCGREGLGCDQRPWPRCELPARVRGVPLWLPDWLSPVRCGGWGHFCAGIEKAPQQSLKVVQSSFLLIFGDTNTITW